MSALDILAKLFGSTARPKLLRLFLLNPETSFDKGQILAKTRVHSRTLSKELAALMRLGFLKKRVEKRDISHTRARTRRAKVTCYYLNPRFALREPLTDFLARVLPVSDGDIVRRLRTTGVIKLVVLSGVLVGEPDRRLDLLIVGDRIRDEALAVAVKQIEVDVGRDVRFATLSTSDFFFRRSMQDKLMRDVFDFSHRVALDRIGIF